MPTSHSATWCTAAGTATVRRSMSAPAASRSSTQQGAFLGYRGVCTDVTAAIRADQAEEALRKAQAELAHVTRVTTLGELTASIAHEINQPLAAVIANADACLSWLQRNPPDLNAARRSVDWIIEDGKRASDVIRHVRALAKQTDIEMVPLDASAVVLEAVALVQREMASHAVSVRMELSSALPEIFGDRIQLQQVLINLIMNGIEAMEGVDDRPRELAIRSAADGDHAVLVSVADSGAGICEQAMDRLFTPFFTTKSSGMGMGLSICRSIVEAHGGRLSAAPNQGHGATFQITLPVHREGSIVTERAGPSPAQEDGDEPVVFIVDDDASMRRALTNLFESVGSGSKHSARHRNFSRPSR